MLFSLLVVYVLDIDTTGAPWFQVYDYRAWGEVARHDGDTDVNLREEQFRA
jgi:hypothetical protein